MCGVVAVRVALADRVVLVVDHMLGVATLSGCSPRSEGNLLGREPAEIVAALDGVAPTVILPNLCRALEITGVLDLVEVVSTREDALKVG